MNEKMMGEEKINRIILFKPLAFNWHLHRTLFLLFCPLIFILAGCYQPKVGCLDIRATNYDVSADDPCVDNCCKYPTLLVVLQHRVVLPGQPDTAYLMRYDSVYPSPFEPSHYFSFERSRFFLTDFRLVGEDGKEISTSDSLELQTLSGVKFWTKNSFVKSDRDIFQNANAGVFIASGVFTKIRFTLGLDSALLQTNPDSVATGHSLNVKSDSLIYEVGVGYLPNRLIFRRDTLPGTNLLELRFFEPKEVELTLDEPFRLEQGFNFTLTLRIDYLTWFKDVDLINDSPVTIQAKIDSNLTKAISVTGIEMQ